MTPRVISTAAVAVAGGAAVLVRKLAALREAKQLIEVGEVLRVGPTPHGRRTPAPADGCVRAVFQPDGTTGSAT